VVKEVRKEGGHINERVIDVNGTWGLEVEDGEL